MITISRDGEQVVAKIDGRHPIDRWWYSFTWGTSSQAHAALLAQNLAEHLRDQLRAIKKGAYDRGWHDAKKKCRQKQRVDFCGNWDTDQ